MARWDEIGTAEPDFAAKVATAFRGRKHHTLATLRRDGSPRISGTEVEFADGDIWLGSMPGAFKARDLQRDARFALHSATVDPPPEDPSNWPGEAKIAGRATEVGQADAGGPHRFRLDLTEIVFTHVEGDELVVESWHPGRGLEQRRRT
jgi:hypothetical protein